MAEQTSAVRYEALRARDSRFDGLFFVGVTTTGVYCRPICPARTPRRERCVFFARACEAERDGFRACFRCRPELAPGSATVDAGPRLVAAATSAIEAGFLNDATLDDLARSLRVTSRHLRRQMEAELGVAPVVLAQTKRLAVAKQLLAESQLALSEIAHAAGFGSIRRFNAAWKAAFGGPPSIWRASPKARQASVALRLDYREPFDFELNLGFLGARATAGVESASADAYARTVSLPNARGWLRVERHPARASLSMVLSISLMPALPSLIARTRRLFDLDAQPLVIREGLARDPLLRKLLAQRPGLRVPGAFDPFELAVRAVLGQQISVRAATTLSGRFAEAFGEQAPDMPPGLSRFFPEPAAVAGASAERVAEIGLPRARARTVVAIARAFAEGPLAGPQRDLSATVEHLLALPGVGPWTAQYVAMRAFHFPDAFPAGDLAIKKALSLTATRDVEERAEAWRPWRAYAALHLWSSLSTGG